MFVTVFVVAFLLSAGLTPLAIRLGHRWELVAPAGGRRQHAGIIPITGSLPIAIAFSVAGLLAWSLSPPAGNDLTRLRGVLLGGLFIFVAGWVDDRYELSPRWIFGIQLMGIGVAMWHEVFIEVITNPLTGKEINWAGVNWLTLIVTVVWIAGMVNTVNFLDGLDGLAAGIGAIAALMFAWHSYNLEQFTVALFPLALAGALLGFLPFNFSPARIFLGSGAYFLGYQLALMSIIAPAKIATALLVMAVPIWDIAWQIYRRLRQGQSPFTGDRGHLHFRLKDAGISTPKIVLGYYFIATAFGFVAIFATGKWKLGMLISLTVMLLCLFAWFTQHEVKKR